VGEADHSPPSSGNVKELVELYLHSPNMPSWHGAQLKHRKKTKEMSAPTHKSVFKINYLENVSHETEILSLSIGHMKSQRAQQNLPHQLRVKTELKKQTVQI
jgi:hypothetical protein